MYLTETFLDSTILQYDANININDYLMMRVDHLSKSKSGGACHILKTVCL